MVLAPARELSVSEIETVASHYKEDLQRHVERKVRQKDMVGALSALEAKEFVDGLVYQLKQRANSRIGLPKPIVHRAIHISQRVRAYARTGSAK